MIELRSLISQVQIGTRDMIQWNNQSNIKISDVWSSIRSVGSEVPWYDLVWHNLMIPKYAFLMWLIVKNRLFTRDRMSTFGIQTSLNYLLCANDNESVQHLFFNCSFSQVNINACPESVPRHWLTGSIFFERMRGNSAEIHLSRLFISVAAYSIWTERNARLHLQQQSDPLCILTNVKRTVIEKISTCGRFKKFISRDSSIITLFY